MSYNVFGSPGQASTAPTISIPAVAFAVISPLIVAVRFWSRMRLHTKLGADDWCILAALIFALAMQGVLIGACYWGYGIHGKDLTAYNKWHALQLFVFSQYFYKCSINLSKASILLLYLRLFVQKPFRLVCWYLLGFVGVYGIATLGGSIFQCTPIPRSWNKAIPGTCINTTAFWYANAAFSILGDVIILLVPMPVIYQLKLQLNQKLSLMVVFALGIFIIITSVLRMTTLDTTSKSPDPTWEVGATTWTIIEPNIAIICGCLPMCRMPLAQLFPKLFPSTYPSRSASNPFTHAETSKNDWTPSEVGRTDRKQANASIVAGRDSGSEEFILHDRNVTYLQPVTGSKSAIQKTTHISVKYDDDRSMTSGERTPIKFESKFDSNV